MQAEALSFWNDLLNKGRYSQALSRLQFLISQRQQLRVNLQKNATENAEKIKNLELELAVFHTLLLLQALQHQQVDLLTDILKTSPAKANAASLNNPALWQSLNKESHGLLAEGLDCLGLAWGLAHFECGEFELAKAYFNAAIQAKQPQAVALYNLCFEPSQFTAQYQNGWQSAALAPKIEQRKSWGLLLLQLGNAARQAFFNVLNPQAQAAQMDCIARSAEAQTYALRGLHSGLIPKAWLSPNDCAVKVAVIVRQGEAAFYEPLLAALAPLKPALWALDGAAPASNIVNKIGADNAVLLRQIHIEGINVVIDARRGGFTDTTSFFAALPCPLAFKYTAASSTSGVLASASGVFFGLSELALADLPTQLNAAWRSFKAGHFPLAQWQAPPIGWQLAAQQVSLWAQAASSQSGTGYEKWIKTQLANCEQNRFGWLDLLAYLAPQNVGNAAFALQVANVLAKQIGYLHASFAAQAVGKQTALPKEVRLKAWVLAQDCAGKLKLPRWVLRSSRSRFALDNDASIFYTAIAGAFTETEFYQAAHWAYEKAITYAPANSGLKYDRARNLLHAGQLQPALAAFQEAELLAPGDPNILLGMAFTYLSAQHWKQGWQFYEHRTKLDAFSQQALPLPEWTGQNLDGKRIVVLHQQGLGDTVMYGRFAIELAKRGANVTVMVQPRLAGLLKQWVGRWGKGQISNVLPENGVIPKLDFCVRAGSLPALLGGVAPKLNAYLAVKPSALPQAQEKYLKVGLVWGGTPDNGRDHVRSTTLSRLAPLLKLKETYRVQFYNLQMGEAYEQAKLLPEFAQLIDLAPHTKAFLDTAQQIAALDLVVSTCTSVVHVAGALGKPVWLLLDQSAEWRNGDLQQKHNPFYSNTENFRQQKRGQWALIVAQVTAQLKAVLQGERALAKPPALEQAQPLLPGAASAPAAKPLENALIEKPAISQQDIGKGLVLSQALNLRFLSAKMDNGIGAALRSFGSYAPRGLALCQALLGEGDVVCEIGAGSGSHTVPLALHLQSLSTNGRLLAFEAQRAMYQLLVSNITLNELNNVQPQHAFVTNQTGRMQLPSWQIHQAPWAHTAPSAGQEMLASVTLDTVGFSRLNLVKINDPSAIEASLAGAAQVLAAHQPILVLALGAQTLSAKLAAQLRTQSYELLAFQEPEFVKTLARNSPPPAAARLIIAIPKVKMQALLPALKSFEIKNLAS